MDIQYDELTPVELLKHAKKHPHTHNVSTQAFSVNAKDYVVHNISMKGDPSNQFDVANYRRGLAFMEEIINFKEENLRVAKKGLRKFHDMIPQFLDTKVSHVSTSRHFLSIKNKIFEPLKNQAESYHIYSTQKANGQNAQISWDEQGKFWVIGSKNKTLLLSELKDTKFLTHKFEHVRTISIAEQWFKFLQNNSDKIEEIKQKLSTHSLVGEICDSQKSGHIVDYGSQVKLFFYALVGKNQRQYSCQAPSHFLQFAKNVGLEKYCVRFDVTQVKTYEALIEQLKKEMNRIYEGSLEKYGEGTVVYITMKHNNEQYCYSVCKIKTLQYRIYRKLREKLKAFFEKYRKSYQKMLNKYIQEVKQLTRGFVTPKPEQYYFNIAKRAFQFCQNQEKAITKFFHNRFISFLKLLQNQKIDKETFKKIVHQDVGNTQIKKMLVEEQQNQLSKKQGTQAIINITKDLDKFQRTYKNHPENGLKPALDQIKKASQRCPDLNVKVVCILPKCDKLIAQKGKYYYPFSVSYIACCLKRVISRQQHQTLEGDQTSRANVCINFANMFRNFILSDYNLSKHFSSVIWLPFTKQQILPQQINDGILKVMLGSKPGKFDEHPGLQKLVEGLNEWKNQQPNLNESIQYSKKQFLRLFQQFDSLKVNVGNISSQFKKNNK